MTQRWYVVQTQTHAEDKAAANLLRQEFDVYLPRFKKRRRHARRTEIVSAPLFPRYLFVGVDMATQRWRSIRSTFGVSNLVCNGDEPAVVGTSVIDALRKREDDRGFIILGKRLQFSAGDRVRVVEGAFADCLGLFEGMRDEERVTVLLDLLGRKVRVMIDELAVAAA
jgi:transcriptional antiterminator RfaH